MDADENNGDWEDKLSSWKQRRRSKPNYQHVQDLLDENENTSQRKPKTFQEMVQASEMPPPGYGFNDPFNDDAVPTESIPSEPQSVLLAAQQQQPRTQLPADLNKQKFFQKVIRIRQLPNSGKGFGFSLSGGHDSSSPIIVDKVVRGGSADVCELKAGDEVIAVNGAEISSHFMERIEALIQQSVLSGQLELLVRRNVRLGDDDEVFSDDEFEAELQRKRETQRPVVQLFSQSSEPANSTSDDVPPPLPSVPPPPMESALHDELFPSPPAHLVSSSSDIVLESPTQQPNRTSGLSYQNSQQQASDVDSNDTDSLRRSQLRRRMEFLGLKPEDSEEYRALQENKLQEAKPTRQQFFPTNSGNDHRLDTFTGIDARSESSLANTGSISARIDVSSASTGVNLSVNDPPNITPDNGSVVRNDRSSPALRGAGSVSRMEPIPTRTTSMSPNITNDKANEERRIKLEIESSRKTDDVDREEIAWNRRPSQPQHDFGYDDDEQERLRWKQQHSRTEQAKLQRKKDPVTLEKDRLVEAREEQRLLRHIALNQSVSTPSVAIKQVQPAFSQPPSHRQFSGPGFNLGGSSAQRQLSVTSAPANRESRPVGESRPDDGGRLTSSRTIEMLPYNLPGSQAYIESFPLSAVSSETILQYPQPTNNAIGTSAGGEPFVSTARPKYYDDQANNGRRANTEQPSLASRSNIDQSSNATRQYPVQPSVVAGRYADLPIAESRGYTDQPNMVYRGYTGQQSVDASGYLDQPSADKRSYTSRPGPATTQYSYQPGKASGASYTGDRREVVEGYGSHIWQRELPPKEYSVQAGQVPRYTGPSSAKAADFQPAAESKTSTSTGLVGGYDDESSNQSAVDDLFGNTYRRRSTSQNTQPGPTPIMAPRSGPLDGQQGMRSSGTTDGPLLPGTVPSYGNRGADTRSDYLDGRALPLPSAGFAPSGMSPLGRTGTSPASDNSMSTAYQQPTSYSSYASVNPSGPGYGTSAAYNTPRNALLTARQHSRSSSNPTVGVPPPTSGSNFSSPDAVDSLFAYHKTNVSSDNLSNQQQPPVTSQYVPPASAVHHISQQSQYAQLAGPGPAAAALHTTNVTRYQYGTDKSMFCIRCGVSLYGVPVRFIDNQLVCTRCDATRSTNTGVRYSEL